MEKTIENPTEYLILLESDKEIEYDDVIAELVYNNFNIIDWDKIHRHYEKKTSILALCLLGIICEIKKDYKKAKIYYEKGVQKGNSSSMTYLGNLYNSDLEALQNTEKAIKYHMMAIEKGNLIAMYNLGCMYHFGTGLTKNYGKAKSYYEMAIKKVHSLTIKKGYLVSFKGCSMAMNNLGNLYQNGFGVTKDYEKAKSYYEPAIEKGHSFAMNNMGYMYQHGLGVTKDYEKARYYYEMAIEKKNNLAANNLKQIIREDIGNDTEKYIEKHFEQYIKETKEMKEMKKKLQKLEEENAELRLLPDAPDYLKAKEHFETSASK